MSRILIFGNSGSGKSTLAKRLSTKFNLAHLDLDILAWMPGNPPERKPIEQSKDIIDQFISSNKKWVIEGCYTDLLELVKDQADEIVFLNLTPADCKRNARMRAWEPHKYKTKEEQDKNLDMLIEWIEKYYVRDDVFSYKSHLKFYNDFNGKKSMYKSNVDF